MAIVIVDHKKVMQRTTLHVKYKNVEATKLRLWLGMRFIMLATYIMGCGLEVETE